MEKLLLIDGNSIINRAFYGIMGNKMLMLEDGTYTNAVYGFLAILFKELEDLKPEYLAVAFDLKAPTKRHKMYEGYKATRHGMPDELAMQMPIVKEILRAMNIQIVEKEGYEADDILGTMAKWGQNNNLDVYILTGDRDSFQLIDKNIKVRIPRTKMGKTETEDYNIEKINEEYGLNPIDLIQVKGLMGDSSDNIPGVPGVGEKTALDLIQTYKTIDEVYKNLDNIKGKLKEKLESNKELAYLSLELGTIDINAPIQYLLEEIKVKEWNNDEVYNIFKRLKFSRYIDRFNLEETKAYAKNTEQEFKYETDISSDILKGLLEEIESTKKFFYYTETEDFQDSIINKRIKGIYIYSEKQNTVFLLKHIEDIKNVLGNEQIIKIGYKQKQDYILLKEIGIDVKNLLFDIEIAGYLLNSNINKYTLEYLAQEYLSFDIEEYIDTLGFNKQNEEQLSLFEQQSEFNILPFVYSYTINKLYYKLTEELEKTETITLFNEIEMPLVEVLADMQYQGMYLDREELTDFGEILTTRINELTTDIYDLAEEEFNINSTKQLGEVLFEKLKLPILKKTKTGYATDVDVLEKLKNTHPIIEKILEYRQLMKLNSTYVEGLIPYINSKTHRIHSYFHQTVTATGRISSTEPNLQNIPTRFELGKTLRKVFKPEDNMIYVDADYSQIELRILAHISEDKNMLEAFINDEDIHAQAAAKVLNKDIKDVTKDERTHAKAVNFGIVYGISDFGLAEQLGISRKRAKEYIEQYLEKYSGIKKFMDDIVAKAKESGYVETLYHRRRYIPELSSNNYMVRQFGTRAAMNTPIQGTAADIMKIAMIRVYNRLKKEKLNAKIVLQVHDELLVEAKEEEKDKVIEILKEEMENVIKLKVPLKADISVGNNWLEAK